MHWPAGLKTQPGALTHQPAHVIDLLPTLAEITGASLPARWPDRDLTPIPGVSLAPVLAAKPLGKRPPLYFLFAADRAVRDGDWKLVSFRSNPWELYNLAEDRTELNNLAAAKPEICAR